VKEASLSKKTIGGVQEALDHIVAFLSLNLLHLKFLFLMFSKCPAIGP
jgi:hypothetical protein